MQKIGIGAGLALLATLAYALLIRMRHRRLKRGPERLESEIISALES